MLGSFRNMCAATIALATMIGQAAANDDPSYEETVNFILEKTGVSWDYKKQSISFPERCQMVVTARYTNNDDILDEIRKYHIPLAEMDPSRTEIWERAGSVFVKAKKAAKIISTEHTSFFNYAGLTNEYGVKMNKLGSTFKCYEGQKYCVSTYRESGISVFTFNPKDNLPRLDRAFKHLIKLCGGKEELF